MPYVLCIIVMHHRILCHSSEQNVYLFAFFWMGARFHDQINNFVIVIGSRVGLTLSKYHDAAVVYACLLLLYAFIIMLLLKV